MGDGIYSRGSLQSSGSPWSLSWHVMALATAMEALSALSAAKIGTKCHICVLSAFLRSQLQRIHNSRIFQRNETSSPRRWLLIPAASLEKSSGSLHLPWIGDWSCFQALSCPPVGSIGKLSSCWNPVDPSKNWCWRYHTYKRHIGIRDTKSSILQDIWKESTE